MSEANQYIHDYERQRMGADAIRHAEDPFDEAKKSGGVFEVGAGSEAAEVLGLLIDRYCDRMASKKSYSSDDCALIIIRAIPYIAIYHPRHLASTSVGSPLGRAPSDQYLPKGLCSATTRLLGRVSTFSGNAQVMAGTTLLTALIEFDGLLTSFHDLARTNPKLVHEAFSQSVLSAYADDICQALQGSHEALKENDRSGILDQHMKQILFRHHGASDGYHNLAIVNHGGLPIGFKNAMRGIQEISKAANDVELNQVEGGAAEKPTSSISFMTNSLEVWGGKPQNFSDAAQDMHGSMSFLRSQPPRAVTKMARLGHERSRAGKLAMGNIFRLASKRTFAIGKLKNTHLVCLLNVDPTAPSWKRDRVTSIFRALVEDVMSPVLDVVDDPSLLSDEVLASQPESVSRWVGRSRSRLTQADYATLSKLMSQSFHAACKLTFHGNEVILSDAAQDALDHSIHQVLRSA